jgi:hypothetical protein
MKISRLQIVFVFIVMFLPASSFAEKLDGSKPLICSVIDVIECAPGGECLRQDAASVNLPYFVMVDVTEQTLKVPRQEGDTRVSPIKTVTKNLDGKLILQGAEDGSEMEEDAIGWTMSIDEDDGRMIFSASREKAAFIVFGACTLH